MKKLFFIPLCAFFICSCNDKKNESTAVTTGDSTKMTASTSSDDLVYPYTLEQPYKDWQPGDRHHVVTVLNSLKAWENGDVKAAATAFGDSVDLRLDYYHAKLSNDSLAKTFAADRGKYSNVVIKMGDWESVISKDKKDEYVTLWYQQIITDKSGKTDSIAVVNDAKIVNGKIVELDEKIQHYPVKK